MQNWWIFGFKNCSCWKLAFEDEILNTTETSFVDKKLACEKKLPYSHYLIGNYMVFLIIICYNFYWLLLVIIIKLLLVITVNLY